MLASTLQRFNDLTIQRGEPILHRGIRAHLKSGTQSRAGFRLICDAL